MITPVRSAVAVAALGLCFARAATAQPATATPPAPDMEPPAPEVQYDPYFEPFDRDPADRLQNIVPLPPATPLFQDYDPLEGLDQHVKTSRVALTTRAVFALGVATVKAGEEFTLPFFMHSGPPLSAQTLKIQFDPKVIQAIDAKPGEWKGTSIILNAQPEHITPERKFVAVQYCAGDNWQGDGVVMVIRFRAVGPGDSPVQTYAFDAADNLFATTRSVVRDGLVHVVP